VNALSFALGDIGGKDSASAAIHTRCLVCDKPVRSLTDHTHTHTHGQSRSNSPDKFSSALGNQAGSGYYDKRGDGDLVRLNSTGSSIESQSQAGRFGPGSGQSPDRPSSLPLPSVVAPLSQKELTKITTELSIVRSSLDLPPVTVSIIYYTQTELIIVDLPFFDDFFFFSTVAAVVM
jgi:hypothetical protein